MTYDICCNDSVYWYVLCLLPHSEVWNDQIEEGFVTKTVCAKLGRNNTFYVLTASVVLSPKQTNIIIAEDDLLQSLAWQP